MADIDIEALIPHRAPFLLVDEVVSIDGNTIRTRKKVNGDDPVFKGHFPGFPIMPGVHIVEAIVQSGAILIAQMPGGTLGLMPVLTRLNNGKFKQMVKPGDTIEIEATLKERMANAFFMEGSARVGGKLAVSIDFACTGVPKNPA